MHNQNCQRSSNHNHSCSDSIYRIIATKASNTNETASLASAKMTISEAHQKLGHIAHSAVKHAISNGFIMVICWICVWIWIHRFNDSILLRNNRKLTKSQVTVEGWAFAQIFTSSFRCSMNTSRPNFIKELAGPCCRRRQRKWCNLLNAFGKSGCQFWWYTMRKGHGEKRTGWH